MTNNETVSPAVAEGPYTLAPNGDILAADGTPIGRVPVRWSDLRVDQFTTPRDGWAFAEERARVEGSLLAASWDLLAVCDEAIRNAERWYVPAADSLAVLNRMRAAVAKARGLRPCDDPALVPEVMKTQPQCVHGERVHVPRLVECPLHRDVQTGQERHENKTTGGVWYTYVCDGYLKEQEGREG